LAAKNPDYFASDHINVFLFNDVDTFTNWGQTLDISMASSQIGGTIQAQVGQG